MAKKRKEKSKRNRELDGLPSTGPSLSGWEVSLKRTTLLAPQTPAQAQLAELTMTHT
jgi:hypothetical protein